MFYTDGVKDRCIPYGACCFGAQIIRRRMRVEIAVEESKPNRQRLFYTNKQTFLMGIKELLEA